MNIFNPFNAIFWPNSAFNANLPEINGAKKYIIRLINSFNRLIRVIA
jgi:hypothetical protein